MAKGVLSPRPQISNTARWFVALGYSGWPQLKLQDNNRMKNKKRRLTSFLN